MAYVKKCFCVTNIRYKYNRNYGDIDILAFDSKNKVLYDIGSKFAPSYDYTNYIGELADELLTQERIKKIEEYCVGIKPVKIIALSRKSINPRKRESKESELKNIFEKASYKSEIWYFEDIIIDFQSWLKEKMKQEGAKYDSPVIETLRMIALSEKPR